jgi:hypothetical protein
MSEVFTAVLLVAFLLALWLLMFSAVLVAFGFIEFLERRSKVDRAQTKLTEVRRVR